MKKKLDFSKLSVQSFVTTLNPDQDYKLKGGNTGDIGCGYTVTQAVTCLDCSFRCTDPVGCPNTADNVNCIIGSVQQTIDTSCFQTELCTLANQTICHVVPTTQVINNCHG